MCFSPLASFASAAVLGVGAAVTYRHAPKPEVKPFALIPLVFALHQAIEGVVWLTFGLPRVQTLAVHAYILISHVVWPSFIPYALWKMETVPWRKRTLAGFLWFGIAVSLAFLYQLMLGPSSVSVCGLGLAYKVPMPDLPVGIGAYVIATCLSCQFSSRKYARVFGIVLFGAFVIAYWSYRQSFYSFWCFFAAILSLLVYVQLREKPLA